MIDRPSFVQLQQLLTDALKLSAVDWTQLPSSLCRPSDAFVAEFDAQVQKLIQEKDTPLRAALEFDYDIGKPQEFFLRLAAAAVSHLTTDEPVLTAAHFHKAKDLLEQDHQLAILKTINDHGIALMIGMSHLEKQGQRFFTLEMIYHQWQQFYRKHDLLTQMPTRSEAQKALENLLRLQLVKDTGDAFKIGRAKHATPESLQPEFRVVHLNFAPRTLEGMIRNRSIKCSTAMMEWAINGA